MSTDAIDAVVQGLLNGKKPSGIYLSGAASEQLADALAAKIDAGVAPSLCAHAMCGSSAAGNVAVVRMLSKQPMSKFNKAYNFGEPLRRACRAFVKATDPQQRKALAECARFITAAHGDLNQPDKYLKSGMSAAGSLRASGSQEALALLEELKLIRQGSKREDKASIEIAVKAETESEHKDSKEVKLENSAPVGRKRRSARGAEDAEQAPSKKK